MLYLIQKFDDIILLFIKNNMHGYILDKVMIIITSLGNTGAIWIFISILLILNKKNRNAGFMVLIALLFSAILGDYMLKNLVHRLRPCTNIPQGNLLITKPTSYSFPSGHAAASFSAAGVLAKYLKKYRVEFYTLASLIAFSRLYVYVHYPTDVIAGIILGLICSKTAILVFCRIKRFKPKPKE